jgi:hypothetical protein
MGIIEIFIALGSARIIGFEFDCPDIPGMGERADTLMEKTDV